MNVCCRRKPVHIRVCIRSNIARIGRLGREAANAVVVLLLATRTIGGEAAGDGRTELLRHRARVRRHTQLRTQRPYHL